MINISSNIVIYITANSTENNISNIKIMINIKMLLITSTNNIKIKLNNIKMTSLSTSSTRSLGVKTHSLCTGHGDVLK